MRKPTKLNATCNFTDVSENKEFLFNFQKTILLSLHEDNVLTFQQYNNALELLKKKFCK